MTVELRDLTPYILTLAGLVVTYFAWSIKKILENIEQTITKTALKVEAHDLHITQILTTMNYHERRLSRVEVEVDTIQKGDTIKSK